MKRALVTGGSGYIGRHLIGMLLREGVAVRATARDSASAARVAELGAEAVEWSLEDPEVSPRLLDGVDTVFHLAAPRRVYNQATRTTQRVGGADLKAGSIRLAAIVAASDVARMIVSSSVAVYGKPWGELDETTPAAPVSDYGRGRVDTERTCSEIFRDSPHRLIIARLTETFGPGSPGQLGLLTGIAEGRFRMIGDGRVLHHLSTVDDTAAGLLALARTEAAGGTTLHIGSRLRTLRDFVSAASEALGQPLRATPWAGPPAQRYCIFSGPPPRSRDEPQRCTRCWTTNSGREPSRSTARSRFWVTTRPAISSDVWPRAPGRSSGRPEAHSAASGRAFLDLSTTNSSWYERSTLTFQTS